MRAFRSIAAYAAVMIALLVGVIALPTGAADHLDAPLVMTDGRQDINDVYAFQSPATAANTVLIMTVNPLAGAQSPTTFNPDTSYDFLIDTNGDAKEDKTLSATFSAPDGAGKQTATLKMGGTTLGSGQTGTTVSLSGGGMMRAGVYDDPFFFDLAAFRNGLAFCPGGVGKNFFAGLNVSAIVVEVPSSTLGGKIGVWARTMNGGKQWDRMARPAINTVFIPKEKKDAFNAGQPANDQANFRGDVVATLKALGNDDATANKLADVLLPDILTVDTSSSAGFLNGRKLQDDVIDAELALITGGKVTTDCVANDSAFSNSFPYLAAANAAAPAPAPTPTPAPMPGLPNTGGGGMAPRQEGASQYAGLGVISLIVLGILASAWLLRRTRWQR
jgi:hypothetical protein